MMNHRMPIVASLFFAIAAVPALAADDPKSPTDTTRPSTTTSASQGKQVTLSGKIVDLHEYFTGQKDSSSKPSGTDSTRPSTGTDTTRPGTGADSTRNDTTRTDTTRPDASRTDSSARAGMKSHQQYMALTNASMASTTGAGAGAAADRTAIGNVSGTIILCFADAPSVFAVPRSDDTIKTPRTGDDVKSPSSTDRPATPGTTDRPSANASDKSDKDKDHGQWRDKQVQVTGTLYEKDGVKFLLVSRVQNASDASSTTPSTRPGTTPGSDNK